MSEKYLANIDTLADVLKEYGVAIIPDILTIEECDNYDNQSWDCLNELTRGKIDRYDSSTWKYFYEDLFPKHNMLLQNYIGHAQYIWDLRQNEKIVNIFSKFWKKDCEELLVSFDGTSISFPPEITGRGWRERAKKSLHCDQSFTNNEFQCIQSWVTFNDVCEGDASLLFLEGSHNYHKEFAISTNNNVKDNWYKLTPEDIEFYKNKGCEEHIVQCSAGSLVLWDSRTIHCGIEPSRTRTEPNFRNVVYLCYTPRELCTSANLKKKQKAFDESRMTSHWPHKQKLFSKTPRSYGKPLADIKELEKPELTSLGLKLAGF